MNEQQMRIKIKQAEEAARKERVRKKVKDYEDEIIKQYNKN